MKNNIREILARIQGKQLISEFPIRSLKIHKLHGSIDVNIEFKDRVSIFMGRNGVGKSTIINIFVHFLTRKWSRLSKQTFDSVTIEFNSGEAATISRSSCLEIISSDWSPRAQRIAAALSERDLLDLVFEDGVSEFEDIEEFDDGRIISGREIQYLSDYIRKNIADLASLRALSEASRIIRSNFSRKIVYLPTYRRIEQEITEIFSLSSYVSRRIKDEISQCASRNSREYTELVRFGMEDIKSLIDQYISNIRELSRQQVNSLSTRYLTAALRNRQNFDRTFYDALTDKRISEILARVDDEELNRSQRQGITSLIKSLRDRQGSGRLTRAQEHIASYFPMLADTHDRISKMEAPLQTLATVLNRYIGPDKNAEYDQTKYEFTIKKKNYHIPLSGLSSGEKQIVSLFSELVLSGDESIMIVLDEPELSLSVLWQETLIEDILSVKSGAFLVAATHSPFIYGENLAKYAHDMGDYILEIE